MSFLRKQCTNKWLRSNFCTINMPDMLLNGWEFIFTSSSVFIFQFPRWSSPEIARQSISLLSLLMFLEPLLIPFCLFIASKKNCQKISNQYHTLMYLGGNVIMFCSVFSDINECEKNPCSQECANIYGSYQCYCRQGYYLKEDGHTCEGIYHQGHQIDWWTWFRPK